MSKYNLPTRGKKVETKKPTQKKNKKVDQVLQKMAKDYEPQQTIVKPQVDPSTMNVYQKLQNIRRAVAELDIQRSSKNEDKGFTYLELPDYLPQINKLNAEYGLFTHFNMDDSEAVLKITNADNPEEVLEWTLPVEGYEMEDAQKIQILKGTTTYMRRTLFEIAYEISVKDTVDAQGKKEEKPADDLDQRDIQAIEEATAVDQLNDICQNIKDRKGFNKHSQLLKHYTNKKRELQKWKSTTNSNKVRRNG